MRNYLAVGFGMSAFAMVACGGSDESTPATSEDIASYRENALAVRDSATQYQAAMTSDAMTTVAACQDAHDEYDATVRPIILQMQGMGGSMDVFMSQHGGGAMADVGCVSRGMMSELDQHHSVACQLSDLASDRAEAARHTGVMTTYAGHLSERSDQMMGATGDSSASWGPMMAGCPGGGGMSMMHGMR